MRSVRSLASAQDGPLYAAIVLMAGLWCITSLVYQPPAAVPASAPLTEFSAARAQAVLTQLLGDGRAHPLGSEANAAVRARIVQSLTQLGWSPQLQNGELVCGRYGSCGVPTNIVARLAGSVPDSGDIVLCAHYDSVPAGAGASDNMANVATVLEIARILRQRPRARHAVVLLLDDGEEAGLLGAQAFVQYHPWAHAVTAAVNLDARGTSGRSLMFETGTDNRQLMRLYALSVAHPLSNSLLYQVYKRLPNDTDFTAFKAAGYQGFNFAFVGDVMRYHTPLDDAQHVSPGSMQDQGELALSTLWTLANTELTPARSSDEVYFDLFGRILVRATPAFMWPLAALTLATTLVLLLRLHVRGVLTISAWVWGLGAIALSSIGSLVAAGLLLSVLTTVTSIAPEGLYPFVAQPLSLQWCFGALSLLVLSQSLSALSLRTHALGAFGGWALLNAVLSVLSAAAMPAVSYLWLLPGIVACFGLWVWGRPVWSALAVLALLSVSCALWLPLVQLLYAGLGTPSMPMIGELITLVALPMAASYLMSRPTTRRMLRTAAAAVFVTALVVSLLQAPYTSESPQRINVDYLLQADSNRASWIVDVISGQMPPAMRAAAQFNAAAQPHFPWGSRSVSAADAPLTQAPLMRMAIDEVECAAGRTHYRLHVNAGDADTENLFFSPGVVLESVSYLNGTREQRPAAVAAVPIGAQWSTLQLYTVPPQGAELELDGPRKAGELGVIDTRYGVHVDTALMSSRPPQGAPTQNGDVTSVFYTRTLAGCRADH